MSKENDNYHLRYELAGADEIIANLRQQLAEKGQEIEELKLKLDIRAMNLQNINTERMEAVRNQTQLAIQELEKVKEKIEKRNNGTNNANYSTQYKDGYSSCCCDIEEQINQQIKELKGEKEWKKKLKQEIL